MSDNLDDARPPSDETVVLRESDIGTLALSMAARMHRDYLETIKDGKNDDGSFKERRRPLKSGDERWAEGGGKGRVDAEGKINIAVDLGELSPGWQLENIKAAEVAVRYVADAVSRGETISPASEAFLVAGAEAVHNSWMDRRHADGTAETDYVKPNMIPYSELPAAEQEKDLAQIRLAVELVENRLRS